MDEEPNKKLDSGDLGALSPVKLCIFFNPRFCTYTNWFFVFLFLKITQDVTEDIDS